MQKMILASAMVFIVATLSQAGVYGTWQTNGGGAWNTAANWTPSGAPKDVVTDASNPNEKDSARFDATATAGTVTHSSDNVWLMNLDLQTSGWTFDVVDGKRFYVSYWNTGTTYSGGGGVNTFETAFYPYNSVTVEVAQASTLWLKAGLIARRAFHKTGPGLLVVSESYVPTGVYGIYSVLEGTLLLNQGSNTTGDGAMAPVSGNPGIVAAGATVGGNGEWPFA